MRRVVMLALYFLIRHSNAMALPGRFSAECSPSYATNRVYRHRQMELTPYAKGGAIRMHFGGAYYLALQEHCNLSVGLSYALGHVDLACEVGESKTSIREAYFLHYVWVPLLCRFYTSEVMIDTSIYFKLGIIPSINLPARTTAPSNSDRPAFLSKRPLGCFIVLGGGVKYDFSLTNSLVVGLSYCWDLPGVMYKKDPNNDQIDYYCHNDFFCLDICCLF
ncbi:MAG: outer membrane beta-barrel protein [Candidatus Cardinium sp.]|uniref:outer membrane beta-barrel protein n=1 Tax=Cardinium endosymbiont of Dermatophagoides farinae TaxID=2597823 RepID=UPI001182D17E|nr:outer membrane beta-barrel protein [Cardinium endosymbiont of Dermatophagoides farinae]TSJ81280.1 PorT family protein [Cardinium endosymbiont of Dermatophagoides farinae]UWW97338.1 MAG: outer membrane beta-barrel protein [Candidatus Cardinium sp.]